MHAWAPASLSSVLNFGLLSVVVYMSGRNFFSSILQYETMTYESLIYPPKTNTSFCLSLHINSRPAVFTKCLFNENCFVSSLSECLMAPVLLQVPWRGRYVWHKKVEPRTKTNNTHRLGCILLQNALQSSLARYPAHPEVHAISLASFAPLTNRNSTGC